MSVLSNLEPTEVWTIFEEITKVPRPSKKEEKIMQYLLDFGAKYGLPTKRDEIGNVLISKAGTPGMEDKPIVVLQSHMDMVCEANSDVEIDFDNDPITPYIDGEWVKAKGTTLGADDGIGMAAALAILASDKLEHGPIECLFTVDEETGLTGAFELQEGFFKGKILLNLDSEDEGEIFIGCAGGIDTLATFNYKTKKTPKKSSAYKVSVSGLKGGHSGDEIHKGLGNSNKIITRFLLKLTEEYGIKLAKIDGGNKRNAIPREAYAEFTIKTKYIDVLKKEFDCFSKTISKELRIAEPDIKFKLEEIELPENVIKKSNQKKLLRALYACPHGVHAWSKAVDDLVETSTNLASVKHVGTNQILVVTSQRSSVDSGKHDIREMVASVFKLAGAIVNHSDGYPGWEPNPDSEILKKSVASYERIFGKKPVVRAIHAGLECGLFLEKYPDLDMISFGPTLRAVHSPDEKIEIKTVKMWWDHLLDILKHI